MKRKRGGQKKAEVTEDTPLTLREMKFIEHYFRSEPPFNGAHAARMVGYSKVGASVQAIRVLKNANVKAAIERRKAELAREYQITREEWMRLGKAITFHDPGKMYDEHGNPVEIKDLEYGERMAVEGFEFVEDYLTLKGGSRSKAKEGEVVEDSRLARGYTKKFKHTDRHKWFVTMGKVCGFITDEPTETDDELKSLVVYIVNSKGERVDPRIIEHGGPTRRIEHRDEGRPVKVVNPSPIGMKVVR